MEKLIGKTVQTDGIRDFVTDFLKWAAGNTSTARLELDPSGLVLEIVCERNEPNPLVTAKGLAGGGEAVAAWADADGYDVLDSEQDYVTVEATPKMTAQTAQSIASFLGPASRWRIAKVNVRRKQ